MFLCMMFWDKQTPTGGAHSGNRDATKQLITDCKIVNFIPRHFFFALLSVGPFDSTIREMFPVCWNFIEAICLDFARGNTHLMPPKKICPLAFVE